VSDGVVFVAGGEFGGVQTFDAKTGAPGWASASDTSSPWASPVIANGTVFSSGFTDGQYNTGVIYALSASSGKLLWHVNLTTNSDPYTYAPFGKAVADGVVYIAGATPTMFALDAVTGALVWKAEMICSGHLWSTPAVLNRTVYVGCDNGTFFAL